MDICCVIRYITPLICVCKSYNSTLRERRTSVHMQLSVYTRRDWSLYLLPTPPEIIFSFISALFCILSTCYVYKFVWEDADADDDESPIDTNHRDNCICMGFSCANIHPTTQKQKKAKRIRRAVCIVSRLQTNFYFCISCGSKLTKIERRLRFSALFWCINLSVESIYK